MMKQIFLPLASSDASNPERKSKAVFGNKHTGMINHPFFK